MVVPIIELEAASVADIPELSAMAERIWRAYYPAIIGEEQVNYMLGLMYSGEGMNSQMELGQRFYFVSQDGVHVGYLAVSDKKDSGLMLNKFYIDMSVQGNGVGEQAFRKLLDLHPNVKQITLTVNRGNYKSINFYFKLGFTIDRIEDFDIGEGFVMEDFVMVRK